MFPKLSTWHWLALAVFLFFYGFAVFALTRDYYLRHPPRPVAAAAGANAGFGAGAGHGMADASLPQELLDADPAVQAAEADRRFVAGQYGQAVALYRRAIAGNPADIDSRNDLGLALHYAGDTGGGLAVLKEGAEAAPKFQRIWLSLGFVAAQAGDASLARDALTKARDLDPASEVGVEAERMLKATP